jgi:TnpA family transposase
MADTYTVFAQKLIPGTQRDSLHVLDGLLANQTGIQPEMVSTDTAGASEIVFCPGLGAGLPVGTAAGRPARPAAVAHRPRGPLRAAERAGAPPHQHPAHRRALDEICRLTASLRAGIVIPSAILRRFQRGPSPSSLARALAELGRVIKTLHVTRIRPRPGLPADHPPPSQPR